MSSNVFKTIAFILLIVVCNSAQKSSIEQPLQQLQQVETSTFRQYNFPSTSSTSPPTPMAEEDVAQRATVLFSQPPKPPLQMPTENSDIQTPQYIGTTPTTTTSTQAFQETTHSSTVSVPKAIDSQTCEPLEGNLDKLTLDQFTNKLTESCRYDKVSIPTKREPLDVILQLNISHIEASEQLQFKMHMLIQYRYVDDRLRYQEVSPNRGPMLGEEPLRTKLWVPHLVLSHERESTMMGLEGSDQFISISPDGEVMFSYRLTTTIYCWMDLKKFPFDTQSCDLTFRSWTYNASKLILKWADVEPVSISNQLHLTEFTLIRFLTYNKLEPAYLSYGAFVGNYSLLVFEFVLQREIGYYIMDYFIPSILLVSTSWVTFWLQADNAAPRITLGTSTMLAFITLAQGQSKNLPKVSYIKASEIWFLGCTVFIFASMVEFAFVNIIWRRRKKVELKKVNSKYILKSTITPRLARKEFQKSASMNNLHKSRSCSSLTECSNANNLNSTHSYNNYLTVHSFPSTITLPKITTNSENDLINSDSHVTIPIPSNNHNHNDQTDKLQKWTSMTPQEVAIWIDKRSRIVFPGAFLVFNIFYWAFVYGL